MHYQLGGFFKVHPLFDVIIRILSVISNLLTFPRLATIIHLATSSLFGPSHWMKLINLSNGWDDGWWDIL
jgi:hypothetical protein